MRKIADKKIIVALSGGVDSAVAAAMLKKQGLQVLGVFFIFYGSKKGNKSLVKAKRVAKKLDISLEVIDARKVFKKNITDYFVESYKKGLTPNPCVACNKEMKLRLLFDLMKKYKADFVATGHYARLRRELKTQKSKLKIKENYFYKLLEAKDKTKDQSYFLYRLTQRELAKIIFPLGEYKKTETKKMAKKFGLPVLGEEESQDICFLLGNDINSFLKKYIKLKPGNIVDEKGKVLGKHKGLPFYTIGQRKGIEIGGQGPYFVVRKNLRGNELIVTNNQKKLLTKKFFVNKVSWANKEIKLPIYAQVQIRYHAPKISAKIALGKSGNLVIEAKRSLRAVTPGQSAVFYRGEEVIGGGIISNLDIT